MSKNRETNSQKARRRRARKLARLADQEAIALLIGQADALEAELETADILDDPATLAAIAEGQAVHGLVTSPDFWSASGGRLHRRETAEHSMQLNPEQDEEPDSDEGVLWDGTRTSFITVRYEPSEGNDPWGLKQWTEAFKGTESVGEVKDCAVRQMHFGNPDGFRLVHKDSAGGETLLTDFDVISDVLRPGATVFLVR